MRRLFGGVRSIRVWLWLLMIVTVFVIYKDRFYNQNVLSETMQYYSGELEDRSQTDMDALEIFPKLEFNPSKWTLNNSYFWNEKFEDRFEKLKLDTSRPRLKILIIPHAHVDPGWGYSIEDYYTMRTRKILDNLVHKLTQYKEMKFLWAETSFLNIWWNSPATTQEMKNMMKKLVEEKRLEIVTGAFVMTDEAVVGLYSMIDQLVEGNHWVKTHLNTLPTTSWSVDPFGFRIHYAWKKWLAEKQQSDWMWQQRWDSNKKSAILCHHIQYTMYLIPNSLGPNSKPCRVFDFGTTGVGVNSENIQQLADLFVSEAGRSGSLTKHNVVMGILGGDFYFQKAHEWDRVHENYVKLFNYIKENEERYNAEVSFGTPSDFFNVIQERQHNFPTFTGDLIVYSDTLQTKPQAYGRTAYWSGFYSSRPYWKKLYRETENAVRSAEILYSVAHAGIWSKPENSLQHVSNSLYTELRTGRQHLALFAHHDASPGVSSRHVMVDFGEKLLKAYHSSIQVQMEATKALLGVNEQFTQVFNELQLPKQFEDKFIINVLSISDDSTIKNLVFFNSLGWARKHYAKIIVDTPYVQVLNDKGTPIDSQINPIFEENRRVLSISSTEFELVFIAELPALTLTTYKVEKCSPTSKYVAQKSKLSYNLDSKLESSDQTHFTQVRISSWGSIHIENSKLQLKFDSTTGFLQSVFRFSTKKNFDTKLNFGGYYSVDSCSGPYLFMHNKEKGRQTVPFPKESLHIITLNGIVSSEVIARQKPILQSVTILQDVSNSLQNAIFITNEFNPEFIAGEYYMRVDTDLNTEILNPLNGEKEEIFFSDQSGFTFEKRIKVEEIEIEGNYYPITNMAYIQDVEKKQRMTLIVDRAQGVSSFEPGRIEVMIDRRVLHDDNRGIGQGITDNRNTRSNYILLLEPLPEVISIEISTPTIFTHHLTQELSYPPSLFYMKLKANSPKIPDSTFSVFNHKLPCDSHLLNFRTFSDPTNISVPTNKALLLLHKLSYMDSPFTKSYCDNLDRSTNLFYDNTEFTNLVKVESIVRTDLTGLRNLSNVNVFQKLSQVQSEPFEITGLVVNFKE